MTKSSGLKMKKSFKLKKIEPDDGEHSDGLLTDGFNTWNDGWPHYVFRGVQKGAKLDEDAQQKYQGVFDEHWLLVTLDPFGAT